MGLDGENIPEREWHTVMDEVQDGYGESRECRRKTTEDSEPHGRELSLFRQRCWRVIRGFYRLLQAIGWMSLQLRRGFVGRRQSILLPFHIYLNVVPRLRHCS